MSSCKEKETRRTQNIQLLLGLQDQRAGGKHARQVLELEGQRDDAPLLDALVLRVDALDGRLGRRLGARGQVYLGAGLGQQGDGRYPYPAAGVGVTGVQLYGPGMREAPGEGAAVGGALTYLPPVTRAILPVRSGMSLV